MVEWLTVPSAAIFAACCAFEGFTMLALALATPLLRQRRNVWLNDEDAKRFSGTVADLEHRDVARLIRVHRNLLENFVPFVALGFLWIATGAPSWLGVTLFVTFAVARTAHVTFYLTRNGRLRTASHTVSFLVLVILTAGVSWRAVGAF